ncbi:hypothetical protein K227x_55110 [Rubripirellula lacrimiformis]|uniref:Uncharacterized protein n=1 Tax=Rubripirellula lacrimiformis TaxID=1930273 RepID=A0A517NIX5_9BACT|nr:hypothetical protein K227x_55110 [Rubripirellula lacrimiformis]
MATSDAMATALRRKRDMMELLLCRACKKLRAVAPRILEESAPGYRVPTACTAAASMQRIASHLVVQCADADAQRFGRPFAVQIACLQSKFDGFSLAAFDGFGQRMR